MFFQYYSATTELLRKELGGHKLNTVEIDLFQNNWLVFVVFLIYNFHCATKYYSAAKKLIDSLFSD